jgi:hypothetical protein
LSSYFIEHLLWKGSNVKTKTFCACRINSSRNLSCKEGSQLLFVQPVLDLESTGSLLHFREKRIKPSLRSSVREAIHIRHLILPASS